MKLVDKIRLEDYNFPRYFFFSSFFFFFEMEYIQHPSAFKFLCWQRFIVQLTKKNLCWILQQQQKCWDVGIFTPNNVFLIILWSRIPSFIIHISYTLVLDNNWIYLILKQCFISIPPEIVYNGFRNGAMSWCRKAVVQRCSVKRCS